MLAVNTPREHAETRWALLSTSTSSFSTLTGIATTVARSLATAVCRRLDTTHDNGMTPKVSQARTD
jgi:hypothetical protein